MPLKLNSLALNDRAEDGAWIDYDKDEGARFKLRSTKSKIYQQAAARAGRGLDQRQMNKNPERWLEHTIILHAECVILDWEGIDWDGPFPCTPENKLKLLQEIPDLREWIFKEAMDLANFQAEAVAEDAAALKSGPGVAPPVG